MKDNLSKYKYFLLVVVSIITLFFMYLNRVKINEQNKNLLNLNNDNKITEKLSEDEKNKIINDATIFINENLKNIYYYLSNGYENINDMDNPDKLWMSYWYLKDDKNNKYLTDYTDYEILEKMQFVFGSKLNIIFDDIKDYNGNRVYKFNDSNSKYESVH